MNKNENKRKIYTVILATLVAFIGFAPTTLRAQIKHNPNPNAATAKPDAPTTAPANDNFATGQVLMGVSGSVMGTNVGATKEAGEASHALNRGGHSVWYKYIATGDGVLTVDTVGSNFDTLLAVYDNSNFNDRRSYCAENDDISDSPLNTNSRVVFAVTSGRNYYIAVDGYGYENGTAATGNINLNYSLAANVPNDNFAGAISLSGASGRMITTTNIGAGKEAGEPNHAGNAGGKSIWFKWTAPAGVSKSYTFAAHSHSDLHSGGVDTLITVYTGASVNALTSVANKEFYGSYDNAGKLIFQPTPGATYYIALDGYYDGQSVDSGTFNVSYGITKTDKSPDFDRDGKTDITVFRPTTGTWYSLDSITDNVRGYQWGMISDKPMISDEADDAIPDRTVYRPSVGVWFTDSSYFPFHPLTWGENTDIPMLFRKYYNGGYGYKYSNEAVFRPTTGVWYIYGKQPIAFGQLFDKPMTADFTGDGTDEIAVFRPSNGTWYIYDTVTGQYTSTQFGANGDRPVAADFDGDGRADIAVYRASTGAWYVLRSSDNQVQAMSFGVVTDIPQPADYDGDGKADYAVYRPGYGTWYIWQSNSQTMKAIQFGATTDIPVSAPNQLQ